jgi:predicted dehydrogenase
MKVLILGFGSIARKHVQSIQKIVPGSQIFALRSGIEGEKYPGVTNIFSLSEIDARSMNFCIISTPTSEHKNSIEQVINYGVPLFIEKPIHNSLQIRSTVLQLTKANIVTYVACNLRFLDSLQYLKKNMAIIERKKINEVNVYNGSYLPDWRKNINFRDSYSANRELGGGVHLDLIHELDYIYWMFGIPLSVYSQFKNQSMLEISAFDYANYLLEYDGFCASVVLNYYRRDSKRTLELVFADETWEIDILRNKITSNNQSIFSSEQSVRDTYDLQMEYFIQCLETHSISFNTIDDGFNVLEMCLNL